MRFLFLSFFFLMQCLFRINEPYRVWIPVKCIRLLYVLFICNIFSKPVTSLQIFSDFVFIAVYSYKPFLQQICPIDIHSKELACIPVIPVTINVHFLFLFEYRSSVYDLLQIFLVFSEGRHRQMTGNSVLSVIHIFFVLSSRNVEDDLIFLSHLLTVQMLSFIVIFLYFLFFARFGQFHSFTERCVHYQA